MSCNQLLPLKEGVSVTYTEKVAETLRLGWNPHITHIMLCLNCASVIAINKLGHYVREVLYPS